MNVDAELVAIGISLLGIVLWTWISLRRIDKKLDALHLLLASQKKKDTNYTDSIKPDN